MYDFKKHRYIVVGNLGGYVGYNRKTHKVEIVHEAQDAMQFEDLTTAYEVADLFCNVKVHEIECAYTIMEECPRHETVSFEDGEVFFL